MKFDKLPSNWVNWRLQGRFRRPYATSVASLAMPKPAPCPRFLRSLSDKRNGYCEEHKRAHTSKDVQLRKIRAGLRKYAQFTSFHIADDSCNRDYLLHNSVELSTLRIMITDMITGIIGVLMDRVQDMEPRSQIVWQLQMGSIITPKVLKWLAGTIRDNHRQLSQSAPDWTTEFDRCEERQSHLCQLYSISSNIRQRANTVMRPYDGIRTWFLWLQWWCLFVAGILWIHGATGWTVWALSGDQRIQHVFKARGGSIDVSYPHVGMDSIWLSDSPNWVWQVCDSLSERIRTHGGSRGGRTVWAGELVSTCKAFDF